MADRLWANRLFESMYRVDLYRRYLPRNGIHGLVQFYGLRATRSYPFEERAPKWVVDDQPRLHTVETDGNLKIKK